MQSSNSIPDKVYQWHESVSSVSNHSSTKLQAETAGSRAAKMI